MAANTSAPRGLAVALQRHSRTLQALADQWAGAEPVHDSNVCAPGNQRARRVGAAHRGAVEPCEIGAIR